MNRTECVNVVDPTSPTIMLGRYRIDAKIGEGAMADVYRAYDASIDRPVAIKVLKEDLARNAELCARFLREARAAGALNHPNIATIYDVGVVEGVNYIAMELIEGQTLDEVLQAQGRLTFERVIDIGFQLASALGYAHRSGVVHRDLKPSNILVSVDGRTTKLLDFGVARIDREAGGDQELGKTQFGQIMGTPRYMSPEQALGNPVDHRSDLFSLGVVLYELLTGKAAFPGTNLATLAIKIAQETVEPIGRAAADCPHGMSFIIEKLLAKKPDKRFQSAQAVCEALKRERISQSEQVSHRRRFPLRLKLLLFMSSVTAIVLTGSMMAVLSSQEQTLERIALVSGTSISDFVTRNTGVLFAENAGLPPEQQDWTSVQAYVASASKDPEIRSMIVADSSDVVRAANDTTLLGRKYQTPISDRSGILKSAARSNDGLVAISDAPDLGAGAGLRFVRPIHYAGKKFGFVEIVMRRSSLDAAISDTRMVLIALALVVTTMAGVIGYLSGAMVTRPLARLTKALRDAAANEFELRISHHRGDEFAAAFDAFNDAAAMVEPRLNSSAEPDVGLTRVSFSRRATL